MKKVVLSLFIMMMGLCFVACSGTGADLKSVVESAQKDGANWTEAQWKDAFKTVMKAAKPMLKDLGELQKKAEGASEEEQIKLLGEMTEKMKTYEEVNKQFEAFQKAAESTEIGKKLSEDKAFQEELAKDLGLEDLLKDI